MGEGTLCFGELYNHPSSYTDELMHHPSPVPERTWDHVMHYFPLKPADSF